MSAKRRNEPGPREQAELAREDRADARDDAATLLGSDEDDAENDDGEQTVEEMLELDQAELDELGLTLDDPHQPDGE
jgi:hypothetical protein